MGTSFPLQPGETAMSQYGLSALVSEGIDRGPAALPQGFSVLRSY
jgi:hypothetical protein